MLALNAAGANRVAVSFTVAGSPGADIGQSGHEYDEHGTTVQLAHAVGSNGHLPLGGRMLPASRRHGHLSRRECVEHQPSPQEYSMSGACTAPSLGAVPERELRVVTGGVVPGARASRAAGTAATVGSIW